MKQCPTNTHKDRPVLPLMFNSPKLAQEEQSWGPRSVLRLELLIPAALAGLHNPAASLHEPARAFTAGQPWKAQPCWAVFGNSLSTSQPDLWLFGAGVTELNSALPEQDLCASQS